MLLKRSVPIDTEVEEMLKTVIYNARIITMSNNDEKSINPNSGKIEKTEYKQALYYENGIIQKVGTNEEILKLKDENTKVINMEGKTILPSFIDSHSHFSAVANSFLQVYSTSSLAVTILYASGNVIRFNAIGFDFLNLHSVYLECG